MPDMPAIRSRARYYSVRFLTATLIIYGGLYLCFSWFDLRFNPTVSQPIGIYQLVHNHDPLRYGELVLFEPADHRNAEIEIGRQRGFFASAMIKRVIALPGDTVLYDTDHRHLLVIRHDESTPEPIALSEVMTTDSHGLPMPAHHFPETVPVGYVWLGSNHILAFDSRYLAVSPRPRSPRM